ncbi:hypothetical protein [Flavobacterium selenitireducens]|uniref:hypothetical protein n=1 Tax=Flavobacterium selenitireducens TaxID=2722704 RepID=UPI00168A6A78|nr:hypothetical protein [Flavobacterium selenitireducens]MBD3584020.1 hypothetical protein [Flavobacterium selenitireducens]
MEKDIIFALGNVNILSRMIRNAFNTNVEENIFGIVIEHVEKFRDGTLEKIKIKQILDLKSYLSDPEYNGFHERIINIHNDFTTIKFVGRDKDYR